MMSNKTEFNGQLKLNDTIVITRKTYFWTMKQLERCYLWSRTLPYEERSDYLINLQRKVGNIFLGS